MNQRSFLLGLLCLGLVVSSCKKDGTNAPGNTREIVWKEIAKISAASKFSRIDTFKVNQNIDNGVLTVAKLRERFTSLTGGVPIMENEYTEETYVGDVPSVGCTHYFTFKFWNLKSRGYPSVYTVGWSDGGGGTQHLSYEGAPPVSSFTFTSIGVGGGCNNGYGYANLEEEIFGFHRNWTVETTINPIAATVWRA